MSPYYFLVYNILLSPGSPGGGGFSLHTVAYTGRDYGGGGGRLTPEGIPFSIFRYIKDCRAFTNLVPRSHSVFDTEKLAVEDLGTRLGFHEFKYMKG